MLGIDVHPADIIKEANILRRKWDEVFNASSLLGKFGFVLFRKRPLFIKRLDQTNKSADILKSLV